MVSLLGGPVSSEELENMTLVGPFQFGIFYGSVILVSPFQLRIFYKSMKLEINYPKKDLGLSVDWKLKMSQ